jgi:hypothetical protein
MLCLFLLKPLSSSLLRLESTLHCCSQWLVHLPDPSHAFCHGDSLENFHEGWSHEKLNLFGGVVDFLGSTHWETILWMYSLLPYQISSNPQKVASTGMGIGNPRVT